MIAMSAQRGLPEPGNREVLETYAFENGVEKSLTWVVDPFPDQAGNACRDHDRSENDK